MYVYYICSTLRPQIGHLEKSPGFFGDLTPQEKPQKSRPTDKKYPENRVFDTRKYGFFGDCV